MTVAHLVNWLDLILAVLPVTFCIVYTVIAPWWKSMVSRAIITTMVGISCLTVPRGLVAIHIHASAYTLDWIEVLTKVPVFWGVGWCILVLVRLERKRDLLRRMSQ